jgi:hypothetical protein
MAETVVGTDTYSVWRIDDLSTNWATRQLIVGEAMTEADARALAVERNRYGYSTRHVVTPDGDLPPTA